MPNVCIERVEMTRSQYQSLKTFILNDRRKKQKEQEIGEKQEQQRREQEERRKKEEQQQRITRETYSNQLKDLRNQLHELKQEKTQLFSQLKKVINDEEETKKRFVQEQRNHGLLVQQQQSHSSYPGGPVSVHSMMISKGSKRPLSPNDQLSPNYGKTYKYSQESSYPHVTTNLMTSTIANTTSSFVHYPTMHSAYQYPPSMNTMNYSNQRMISNTNLQQQLEHANSKSGFSADEKFKLQQIQNQQVKTGSIVSGYPIRSQTAASAFTSTITGQRMSAPMPSALSHSQYTRY